MRQRILGQITKSDCCIPDQVLDLVDDRIGDALRVGLRSSWVLWMSRMFFICLFSLVIVRRLQN